MPPTRAQILAGMQSTVTDWRKDHPKTKKPRKPPVKRPRTLPGTPVGLREKYRKTTLPGRKITLPRGAQTGSERKWLLEELKK